MTREPDQLFCQMHGECAQAPVGEIKAEFRDALVFQAVPPSSPGLRCQCGHRVLRQTQDLADFANRAPRAVMDDSCRHSGPFAAVFLVNVLDHLFAAFMFEIDIDVRRLVTFGRTNRSNRRSTRDGSTAVIPRQ